MIPALHTRVRRLFHLRHLGTISESHQWPNGKPENTMETLHLSLYANLDPENIPSLDDIETESPSLDVVARLKGAYNALHTLLQSLPDLPGDAYPSLWPRVWAWIYFIYFTDTYDIHLHCLPYWDGSAETRVSTRLEHRVLFLQIIQAFRSRHEMSQLVDSEEGMCIMVAELWVLCVERNLFTHVSTTAVLCYFLSSAIPQAQFYEIVDTLGGTQFDLAGLIVKHIELVVGDQKGSTLTASNLGSLRSVLEFLDHESSQGLLSRPAFAARRLARTLVAALCSLSLIPTTESQELAALCLNLFRRLTAGEGVGLNEWVPTALRAGILRAIVACTTHAAGPVSIKTCRELMMHDLTPSLVYYHVLRRLSKAIREVASADMNTTPLSAEWTAFIQLAHSRLAVFESLDCTQLGSLRACDNKKATGECPENLGKRELLFLESSADTQECGRSYLLFDYLHGAVSIGFLPDSTSTDVKCSESDNSPGVATFQKHSSCDLDGQPCIAQLAIGGGHKELHPLALCMDL
ncbi:hypothetical protein MVEN_01332300 [Mycena venus]|uniref:Uncharacterized protein n=1 Tax=Mycena venus TaxID=2733690 RepID=A0A8H6XXV0_9AGAR|nr:hypothetical protein MVEN_01332300 [Mycena venus]